MAAAAQRLSDDCHVHVLAGTAGHELDAAAQVHQQEDRLWLEEVADLVRQGGNLLDIILGHGRCDDHRLAGELIRLAVCDELLVERLLSSSQQMVDEVVDHLQARSLLQKPCRGAHVAGGGTDVAQRASIFVDAQEQQCRLDGGEGDFGLDHLLHEQGGGGSQLLSPELPLGMEVGAAGVMVNHLHWCMRPHALERHGALRVHQQGPADTPPSQLPCLHERKLLFVEGQEVPQVAVHLARQHRHRLRVQLGRSQQRGKGIEIGVLVGQNDVHGYTKGAWEPEGSVPSHRA